MGIYDREYVRREGTGFLGAWADQGAVCKWLIGLTVAVFVANVVTTEPVSVGPVTSYLCLTKPLVLEHSNVWRLLTYAFVHLPMHIWLILANMLLLWWFGREVEEIYGPREFLTFYLAATLVGGVTFVLACLASLAPLSVYLGSTAPVVAVLTLAALHAPRRTIHLFFILPVPLWLLVPITIAWDVYIFRSPAAFTAPASAAAFAFAYGRLHWRLSNWLPSLASWRRVTRRPRLRVYREDEPTPVSVPAGAQGDEEQLEAKIDAILEKISRVGKENLTESEQQLLIRASELFRRRRS
jgi:membrane associated rhomboid family serine protease